jgi:TRAP-type mannitol/chloroaromatic compound transport system permease small subunit
MQELVRYLYATVFMLCAAYTLAEDEHVRVDIFYSNMKKKHKALVNLLGSLIFLIPVCFSILFFSYNYVINSWLQLEGSLEERGLHAVFLLKSLIWIFAIMLILQAIYIIIINTKIFLNKK